MKAIHSEKQVALILSPDELLYITNCVGASNRSSVMEQSRQHFGRKPESVEGGELWLFLRNTTNENHSR